MKNQIVKIRVVNTEYFDVNVEVPDGLDSDSALIEAKRLVKENVEFYSKATTDLITNVQVFGEKELL